MEVQLVVTSDPGAPKIAGSAFFKTRVETGSHDERFCIEYTEETCGFF